MTQSTQPLPTIGGSNSTEDPKVRSLLAELQGILNGQVDGSNLTGGALQVANGTGVTSAGALALTSGVSSDVTIFNGAGPVERARFSSAGDFVLANALKLGWGDSYFTRAGVGTISTPHILQAPTAAPGTSTTQVATTAFVAAATPGSSALVTALPGSPTNGQEILFQNAAMATTGAVWHLKYNSASASAFKWEFVGGSPLRAAVATSESTTSTTFVDLTTVGPSVTTPLAGDYTVTLSTSLAGSSAVVNAAMSFSVGASAALNGDSLRPTGFNMANADPFPYTGTRPVFKAGLAAATALVARYASPNANSANFSDRSVSILPTRVG
jgi:hypothetical protein